MTTEPAPAMAPLAAPSWDRNRVLFEIDDQGTRISCAISREALQDASDRRYGKPAELLASFERIRPRLERVARAKARNRPDAIEGLVFIRSSDLDEAPEA